MHAIVMDDAREIGADKTFAGTILGYQIVCLLGGTIFMHVMLRMENAKRLSGKRDNMHAGKTEEEMHFVGDNRPDFIYTL